MAPDQANPLDSLGEIQAYSGHYDEAIENLNRALAIKPDFFESYSHLGVAYEGKGDAPRAIESYLKAAQDALIDEQRMDFRLRAFRVASELRDVTTARQIYDRWIAPLPKAQWSEIGKAYCQAVFALLEGHPAETERVLVQLKPALLEYFQKNGESSGRKPYWPAWNWVVARAKRAQGKTDEAIALYQEMANPPNPWGSFDDRRWVYEARAAMAELVAGKGDLDRAEKLLEENRKWNPSWAPTRPAEFAVAAARRERVLAAGK